MLLKKINLILFVSACVATVNAGSVSRTHLPATQRQLNFLAAKICSSIQSDSSTSVTNCKENFKDSHKTLHSRSPTFRVWCRTQDIIRFQVAPSKTRQLVVLIPDPLDANSKLDIINYSIIKPKKVFHEISTIPERTYTVYTTELGHDGKHSMWMETANITHWDEALVPLHREYNITVHYSKNTKVNDSVTAHFTWNTTGDTDVCFDFMNYCDNTDIEEVKLWPSVRPRVNVQGLLLNDECQVQVRGVYGTTKMNYRTPNSTNHNACVSVSGERKAEAPADVFVYASEERDAWSVHVRWPKPRCVPRLYNVTVRAQYVTSVVIPGNTTEAVVKGVTGDGMYYNVSIDAIVDHLTSRTSRLVRFPERGGWAWAWAAGAGALWAMVALVALATVRALRRYRTAASPFSMELPNYNYKSQKSEGAVEIDMETIFSGDKWEVRSDRLLLHGIIGEGAFGVVRKGILTPEGKEVAVKMLKEFPSKEDMRSFRAEMELMKSVGAHPHVVSLVGCCSGRRPLIIAEYCSRGDLLSYLRCYWDAMASKRNVKYYNNNINIVDAQEEYSKSRDCRGTSSLVANKLYDLQGICDSELTHQDLLSFCRQIAMGMEFISSNRLVHRDLAARNILVTADRTLKIADFGLSRDIYEENQYKQKGNGKMPLKWMALESLTRRIYTTHSDVWSFGVVLWEVVTLGEAPYPDVPMARLPRLLRTGYRMPKPANCSTQLYDIMLACWRACPRGRPTFAELYKSIDDLLNSLCVDQYLPLELDEEDIAPPPKPQSYIKMLLRGKRTYTRGERYKRPLNTTQSNHYSSPPAGVSRTTV